jgi:hypothetical protein
VHVAHCPERVLAGSILAELVQNDRVVGGNDDASTAAAAAFYHSFVSGEVLETTAASAEMTKLTENTFRDVNITLANELSILCDRFGVGVWELIGLANRHPRVNVATGDPAAGARELLDRRPQVRVGLLLVRGHHLRDRLVLLRVVALLPTIFQDRRRGCRAASRRSGRRQGSGRAPPAVNASPLPQSGRKPGSRV